MDVIELTKITDLEDRHFWYRERRALLAAELRRLGRPAAGARALDVGAAGGGNTRVVRDHGWDVLATDYSPLAVDVARGRGIDAVWADARDLPVASGSVGFVTLMDVLEHIEEDDQVAAELFRVLEPGGSGLVTVPCGRALWSAHDVAVGHVRRYEKAELAAVLRGAGLVVERLWSWNVLLRPVVAMRRRAAVGSDMEELPAVLNGALRAVLAAERYLPVSGLPGVSLVARISRAGS